MAHVGQHTVSQTHESTGGNEILTSSGSGSSSCCSSAASSETSGVSSVFGSSATGASAYTVEKSEDTNEVKLMVAFGRVAIG